jgi:hypothetical protein
VEQSELVEPSERRLDSLARGLAVDVEGSGQFLRDLADRAVTVASVPDEARRRVELMYLRGVEVESAVEELPVEEPPTMATTTSIALRAAADVHIVLMALIALIVLIVSFVRSSLRERRNDGQSENDGSAEDGLAKNVSSRRICELKRVFHCHCSSLRASNLRRALSAYEFSQGVALGSLPGWRRRKSLRGSWPRGHFSG